MRNAGAENKTRGGFEPGSITDVTRGEGSARLLQVVIGAEANVCSDADDSEEENLESDLGQVGTHAFARMEADVDKQRKQILQGQMSEAAVQKQHQRK